jgi:hypothetical protein
MPRMAFDPRRLCDERPILLLAVLVGLLAVLPAGGMLGLTGHAGYAAAPRSDVHSAILATPLDPPGAAAPRVAPAPNWWNITTLSSGAPAARILGTLDWDATDGYSVLFGGADGTGGVFGDTWMFRNGTWTQLTPTLSPTPRVFMAMAYDPLDGYLLLFGGYNGTTVYGDTWSFAHGQWTNITPLSSPAPRYGAQMTYDAADSEMVLYGGTNSTGFAFHDTWAFAHGAWTQLSPATNPGGVVAGAMVYDAADGYVLLEGGSHTALDNGVDDATWRFSGDVWTNLTLAVLPPLRLGQSMEYDAGTGSVLLFGGVNATNYPYSDFWQFRAGAWNEIAASTPLGERYGSGIAWQPLAHYLLLWGGALQIGAGPLQFPVSDGWAYTAALNVTGTATPPAADVRTAIHVAGQASGGIGPVALSWNFGDGTTGTASALNHTYVATGTYTVYLNATDALGVHASTTLTVHVNPTPTVRIGTSPSPADVTVSSGGRVNFTATASGGTAPFAYTWNFGDGGGPGTGNQTTTTYSAAGTYTVHLTVTDAAGAIASANATVNVTKGQSVPPAGSSGNSTSPSYLLYGVIGAIVLAAVVVAALLLLRRKQAPPANPPGPPGYPPQGYYPPNPYGAPAPPPSPPPPTG